MRFDADGKPILPPRRPPKRPGNAETRLQSQIFKALSAIPGLKLFRNNTGMVLRPDGVPLRYGLCVGSTDLIGIYKGRFVALEIKRPGGRATAEQNVFIRTVLSYGGIAGVARSLDDALKILGIGCA